MADEVTLSRTRGAPTTTRSSSAGLRLEDRAGAGDGGQREARPGEAGRRPEQRAGAGQAGDGGGLATGRGDHGLRAAGEGDPLLGEPAGAVDGVGGGLAALDRALLQHRVGQRELELRAGVGAAAQVVVEPALRGLDQVVGERGVTGGVVAAVDPAHPHGGAGRRERAGGGVGLVEGEERVLLALHEQRRRLDPVEHLARGAAAQQREHLGRRPAAGGRAGVEGADLGVEPAAGGARRSFSRGGGGGGVGRWSVLEAGQAGGEEQRGPPALEDAGVGDGVEGGRRGGGVGAPRGSGGGSGGGLREEALGQVVPGDRGDDGVDTVVVAGGEQGDRAAVRAAGDAHDRVALGVEADVVAGRQQVEQPRHVGHLVVRRVEVDQAAGATEAAGGVGQHDVPLGGDLAGLVGQVGLAAAEAVGEHDRRASTVAVGARDVVRRGEHRGVEGHLVVAALRTGLGTDRHHQRLLGDVDGSASEPVTATTPITTTTPATRAATPWTRRRRRVEVMVHCFRRSQPGSSAAPTVTP